jgi:hypothetical protein
MYISIWDKKNNWIELVVLISNNSFDESLSNIEVWIILSNENKVLCYNWVIAFIWIKIRVNYVDYYQCVCKLFVCCFIIE